MYSKSKDNKNTYSTNIKPREMYNIDFYFLRRGFLKSNIHCSTITANKTRHFIRV